MQNPQPQTPMGHLWDSIQSWLFPMLEDEIGELDGKHRQFVAVCELCALQGHMAAYRWCGNGCPPRDRLALCKAFIAKAVWDFATTRDLIDAIRQRGGQDLPCCRVERRAADREDHVAAASVSDVGFPPGRGTPSNAWSPNPRGTSPTPASSAKGSGSPRPRPWAGIRSWAPCSRRPWSATSAARPRHSRSRTRHLRGFPICRGRPASPRCPSGAAWAL